ncbi:tripartite tricarboxylate transporter substrate-binding protein [Bosea sp. R86505]|uniref:tripartite tricarboxylate transporter substrate-binding protein n=1 Tax=Bosea sp. R86505 TaxID=3101710 RepID=UPI00366D7C0F
MKFVIAVLGALIVSYLDKSTEALAQGGSARPIVLVVPFAAGGPTDLVGRLIAQEMSRKLGQQIVVENVGGAGGTTGTARVARAAADGHTLLLSNIGHASSATLYRRLPYQPVDDFSPIGLVVDVPMTLVARADMPVHDAAGLAEHMRANPGTTSIAHAGIGASSQLCSLVLMNALQQPIISVPYTGTAAALNDVVGKRVDLLCDQTTNTTSQINAGAVRALGLTTRQRLSTLPDVPTLAEAGLPGVEISVWHGLYAPKGTPVALIERLSDALRTAVTSPLVTTRFSELGGVAASPEAATPSALKDKLVSEISRWKPVIEAAGSIIE